MADMNEPDRIPSTTARISRHEELDVLRGGLLTYMAINHIPCATWPVTRHPFGFMAAAEGFVLSTARCSYEIVEKAVRAGAARLVIVSLPTSLAVERAAAAGLSLWCLARDDSVLLVNDATK